MSDTGKNSNFRPAPQDDPQIDPQDDPLAPSAMDEDQEGMDQTEENAENPLAAQITELEARLAESKDQTLRALADSENTRRRAQKDREDAKKYAVTEFARDLLGFSDNFRRALDSIPPELAEENDRVKSVLDGLTAMEREILSTFEKHGILKIEPMGELFNPHYHEVMFESPGTGQKAGTIIQVIEPGYVLHDRLLRPARVGVSKDDGSDNDSQSGDPGGHIDTEA